MYHTVQDVAELLKLSRRTVYRMIAAGRLRATRVGKEWRIPEDALAALLGEASGVAEGRAAYSVPPAPRRLADNKYDFMTTDEYLNLPEENRTMHLIHGFLVRDPGASVSHQELVGRLYLLLHGTVREGDAGFVYLAPVDVILDVDTVLQPDLLVISKERREIIGDRVRGAPDLVIEIASPTTQERDLTTKRLLYARYGVAEYWFVSGYDRVLIQFWQPEGDRYGRRAIHKAPTTVKSIRFPSLLVELGGLFAEPTG